MQKFLISSITTCTKNLCLKMAFRDFNLQGNDRANIKAKLSLKVGQIHVTIYCTRIQLRYEVTPSDIWTIADFTSKIFISI